MVSKKYKTERNDHTFKVQSQRKKCDLAMMQFTYIEFLVVELSELGKHTSRLVLVLGHSTRQSFGTGRADGLLMVGDIANQKRAELRDQL